MSRAKRVGAIAVLEIALAIYWAIRGAWILVAVLVVAAGLVLWQLWKDKKNGRATRGHDPVAVTDP
jgi:uncharacterized membrane-anchored protein